MSSEIEGNGFVAEFYLQYMPGHKIFGDSLALSDECFLIAFVIFLRLLLWGSSLVYFSERKKEVWIHRYGVNGIALKKAESGNHRMVTIAGHLCVSSFGPSLLHFCQLESYQRGHFEKSWSYRQNHGSGLLARLDGKILEIQWVSCKENDFSNPGFRWGYGLGLVSSTLFVPLRSGKKRHKCCEFFRRVIPFPFGVVTKEWKLESLRGSPFKNLFFLDAISWIDDSGPKHLVFFFAKRQPFFLTKTFKGLELFWVMVSDCFCKHHKSRQGNPPEHYPHLRQVLYRFFSHQINS